MSSCPNAQSTEVGYLSHQNGFPATESLTEGHESILRLDEDEDEDEDEDVDFNPFLKGTLSPEASSSLSSEIEGLDGEVVDSSRNTVETAGINSLNVACEVQNCSVGDSEHGEEEIVMQTTVSSEGASENEFEKTDPGNAKKRMSGFISKPAIETIQEKDDGSSSGTDVNDVTVGELSNTTDIQKPTIDLDDEEEDAICKRTRARYSLASFTLDELETFLQETDDDDDLQNVDDEEEYKKFLAAVLQGGEDDDQSTKENENADDEDEDNDADFEIELEELLESDVDANTRDKTKKEYGGAGRRPKTRQIRCQNSSGQCKKKNLGQTKRPLRPLLPVLPNGPISSFSTQDSRTLMPGTAPSCLSLTVEGRCINGFAPHQIGQLHRLIHEHVQLLIQVYSLCVLDHSRQHIASQVQRLIFEMLHKRDEVMAWKSAPYPTTCFVPSVPTEGPKSYPKQSTLASSLTLDARGVCSSNNHMAVSPNISPSEGRCEHVPNRQLGFLQNLGGSFWVPSISGRVLSVLDVAPLSLVGRYMHEVDTAVQENRRRYMDTSSDTRFEREPLYPLPNFPVCAQDNCEVVSETGSSAVNVVQSSSSQQPPKKSLAAAIVESTKKQSVALVPREIAKLAQRFFPLSNPELFPHKPPPAAIANRVLFTDAEDELLALGLMEYNTDWKAIQQRFLPCKSKHQIFVRQKNRCSSKAPENPIKAVRRMKTSPLTAQEIACIQEGLKAYKYDWMSVWQFIVPHRDPSLLPRQWRIACGTQKSYKVDEAKKAKRRLYESERRKQKNADLSSWQNSSEKEDCQAEKSGGENNSADGYTDNVGETYVHEAFLADWRPGTFSGEKNLHSGTLLREAIHEWENDYGHKEAPQTQTGNMYQFPSVSKYPQNPSSQITGVRHFVPSTTKTNHCVSHMTSNTSKSKFYYRPYRARRTSGAHLVKLAPDLPPVNLPPSVRVVSQSSFKGSLCGASSMVASAGGGSGASTTDNLVSQLSQVGRSGTSDAMTAGQNISRSLKDSVTSSRPEDSRTDKDKCQEEGGDTDSDLQMHPLLFQAPEDGRLPYYPLNCSNNNCNTFSFFSGNHPQLHLSLSHNPHQENDAECSVKSLKKSNLISRGIDFHPLMQRTDYVRGVTVTTCSTASLSVVSGGKCAQVQYPSDTVRTEFLVNTDPQDLGPKPFTPDEKANELDLEINLSSTSKKEKALKSRDVTVHNVVKSRTTAPDSGTLMITKSANSPIYRHAEDSSANGSKLVSGGQTLVIPSNSISRYNVDDMRDLAQPDIEMEQEELSDSDEENEENVEFECEEMDDSEGEEGSACEQIAEMQNKDVPSSAMKRPATEDASNSQGDIHSLELGFTNQGKDDASNSSWLSLDSCAPDRSSHMMSKYEESMISKGLVAKDLASSRPSRSCRKAKPNTREVVAQKQAVDMAQQLSLGPLAIPIVRKPRKRVCRTNTCLNIGLTVENSSSDG